MYSKYTRSTHVEKLERIIKTLIFKDLIKDEREFYEKLKVDKTTASLIRNGKRKLPVAKREQLQQLFAVNIEFLEKGFYPVLLSEKSQLEEIPIDSVEKNSIKKNALLSEYHNADAQLATHKALIEALEKRKNEILLEIEGLNY